MPSARPEPQHMRASTSSCLSTLSFWSFTLSLQSLRASVVSECDDVQISLFDCLPLLHGTPHSDGPLRKFPSSHYKAPLRRDTALDYSRSKKVKVENKEVSLHITKVGLGRMRPIAPSGRSTKHTYCAKALIRRSTHL